MTDVGIELGEGIIGMDGGFGIAADSEGWIKPPGVGVGDFTSAGRVGSGGELERPNTLVSSWTQYITEK